MPTYVLSYRSSTPYDTTPQTRSAWLKFFADLGDDLVELGQPAVADTSVGNCDTEATRLSGYSIIEAVDLDAAAAIAKGSPAVANGGGVEIGELGIVPPAPTS